MTDSLKNMLTSVDWKKLMSSADAKNALVGSALGGLMLGGASLASDRDPEESKFTPVGDALLGALLGGAAGYGIPKGLAMFRDSGTLAPDNDQIDTDYTGAGLKGFGVGAGLIGASTLPAMWRAAKRRHALAGATFNQRARRAGNVYNANVRRLNDAVARGASPAEIARLTDKAMMSKARLGAYTDNGPDSYKNLKRIFKGNPRFKDYLKTLKHDRFVANYGIGGFGDIIRELPNESTAPVPGRVSALKTLLRDFTSGKHYAPVRVGRNFKIGPALRIAGRAGKYGAVGTALALLAHKAFGPSARDNFKN